MDIFSIAKLQVSEPTVVKDQVITFNISMQDKVFENVKFINVTFMNCAFSNVLFFNCNFQYVTFINCNFIECTFNSCTMFNIKVASTALHVCVEDSTISHVTLRHINGQISMSRTSVNMCELLSSIIHIHVVRSEITSVRSYNNHITLYMRWSTVHDMTVFNTTYSNLAFDYTKTNRIIYKHCNLIILADYSALKNMTFNKCTIASLDINNTSCTKLLGKDTTIVKQDLEYSTVDIYTSKSLFTENPTGFIAQEAIIGYKKVNSAKHSYVILKLEIPKGAIVFSINGSKCRTNTAKVLEIVTKDIPKNAELFSIYNDDFIYEVGKTYEITDFDTRYNIECSSGIHFFKTVEEAAAY